MKNLILIACSVITFNIFGKIVVEFDINQPFNDQIHILINCENTNFVERINGKYFSIDKCLSTQEEPKSMTVFFEIDDVKYSGHFKVKQNHKYKVSLEKTKNCKIGECVGGRKRIYIKEIKKKKEAKKLPSKNLEQ
jgi:hypothetical protein